IRSKNCPHPEVTTQKKCLSPAKKQDIQCLSQATEESSIRRNHLSLATQRLDL
ncbi:hypothetical protein HMPREF2738_01915, partial [Clostridiales bacterium KLE1615]